MVIWLTQLNGAVQKELVGFCGEAKHVKAVANSGTFSVTAELAHTRVNKRNRVVVHTPAWSSGEGRKRNGISPVYS